MMREPKHELGPPITVDEQLNELTLEHRQVVEDFMAEAKIESRRVCSWIIFVGHCLLESDCYGAGLTCPTVL